MVLGKEDYLGGGGGGGGGEGGKGTDFLIWKLVCLRSADSN